MEIVKEIKRHSNHNRKIILQKYFKTEKGEYGEGDKFLGVPMPTIRKIVKNKYDISFADIKILLYNEYNEIRAAACIILINKFDSSPKEVYEFYMNNINQINNWNLVDITAPNIVGKYLINKTNRSILDQLAGSQNLWKKRIAILANLYLIKRDEFTDFMRISKKLLVDKNDLIQKALGWMLREIGKKDKQVLLLFLDSHYKNMSKTTLRYATEKLGKLEKEKYFK